MQKRQLVEARSLDEADALLDKAQALLDEHKDPTAFQEAALSVIDEQAWVYRTGSRLVVPAAQFSAQQSVPLDEVGKGDFWGRT